MARGPAFKLRQGAILALSIHLAFSDRAVAGPTGAVVVNGQVTISQPNTSTTQIQASNGAIINWNQFSIGAGQVTRFIEPSANSAVLNRVVGAEASEILGQLQANGRIFLINPNGIVIGVGGRIDTNGFIASTLDIADADFLAGKLKFFAAGNAGAIENQGMISVGPGGQIALIAPNIENSGVIFAPGGQLLLAAGRKVQISSSDFADISFEVQAPSDSVINLGKLIADSGTVQVFAGSLQQDGVVRADGMVADASGSIRLVGTSEVNLGIGSVTQSNGASGGSITIQSTLGTTEVSGQVLASGASGKGGSIELLGNRVGVESGSLVNASGLSGGGEILVGGDLHGANARVQDASLTYVGQGASLIADATGSGNGGKIVIWSNENTQYYGSLSAVGGAAGGNGGSAEVSGKQTLEFTGAADLGASQGARGSLLLDPLDIIVSANGGVLPSVVSQFTEFEGNVVTISPAGLNLVNGNVVLEAARNVYFNTPTTFTGSSLTVEAGLANPSGSILLNDPLATKGGSITLTGYTVAGPGTISTAGGGVTIAVTGGLSYDAAISSSGGAISLSTSSGSISSAHVNAGSGEVSLAAPAGSLYSNVLVGGTIDLKSAGSQSDTVSAATVINASSTASYVQLIASAGTPLRLGSIDGSGGVYLSAGDGVVQVAGGGIRGSSLDISAGGSTGSIGAVGAPLVVASPVLELSGLGAPAIISLSGSPSVSEIELSGTVAALGASSIKGASNLSSFSLGNGGSALDINAVASGGFAGGLSVQVTNGGIQSTTLNIPGPISLNAAGGATLGTVAAQSLSVSASGAISVTSATTSGGSIYFSSGNCSYYNTSCTNQSPITAGTLDAGGNGSVYLTSSDNGNISVTNLTATGSASLSAANYGYASTNPRTSSILLGTTDVAGDLSVSNYGTGTIVASAATTVGYDIALSASQNNVSLQGLTSTNGSVTISSGGNISYNSISAAGGGGAVSLTATGSIAPTADSATADVVTTGNATLTAGGAIGNPTFVHPLVVQAGAASEVSLTAGTSVGATGKPVIVDTNGEILVYSGAGSFDVTAETPTGTLLAVTGVELGASAAGMGSGGAASFVSKDLSVNAVSNGSTITIGNVQQSADTLNEFSFTASGTSSLSFGDINLTTAGLNEVLLRSGGALTQLQAGTNNINAGYVSLTAGATGAVSLGNVTSAVQTGNSLNISGGDITALNLNAASINVSGANVALGTVNSTGTLRGYASGYIYDPVTGEYGYITDEMHLTATGSLTTTGAVTSATSVFLTSATSMNIAGGSGAITGGDTSPYYYTDTVNLNAGSGTLAAGAISAYQVLVAGGALHTGNITALNGDLTVSGTGLDTGTLSAPDGSATISGTSFATGNISVGNTLNLTATGSYQAGGITLSSGGSTSIVAPGGIDIMSGGSTLTAPTVTLTSTGGAVAAQLVGTTTLGIESAGTIDVASSAALSSLTVQAMGNQFGAASSVTGSGQTFTFSTTGGNTANLGFTSPTEIALEYVELAPLAQVSTINLSSNLAAPSQLQISAPGAVLNANSVISSGPLYLDSAGNINLNSVNTEGSLISATSSAGNISIGTLITEGGDVNLSSTLGSIVKSGAGLIDTNSGGAPAGNVTLSAADSIGLAGSPITVSNTQSLSVTAANSIALDMNGTTLTNLSITTGAGGSGAISIANDPNYAGFSLTRSGGNLELGAVTPATAGNFALVATNGNIVVNGDINVVNLTLDAFDSGVNPNGNLVIQAGAGTRSITASGYSQFFANNDVTIASGSTSASNIVMNLGSFQGYATHDFTVQANGGSIVMNGSYQDIQADNTFQILGGSSGVAGASVSLVSSGSQYIQANGGILVQGGSASGSSVLVQGSYQEFSTQGNYSVLGGSGTGASATVSGSYQYMDSVQGAVLVEGGSGKNAFAEISASAGYQYLGEQNSYYYPPTQSLSILGGTGAGSFALVSASGDQTLQSAGNISVIGGSGAGAYAQAASTGGSQSVGSTSDYYSASTQNILVQAGTGGTASLLANQGQSVQGSGTISVLGGGGSGMTASIVSSAGSQTIGYAGDTYGNSPTQKIVVQGGTGDGAAAFISAASGQTLDAGVSIAVTGGTPGAYAAVSNAAGAQVIGNQNSGYEQQTSTISVQGGTGALSSAAITSGGNQTLNALGAITVNNNASNAAEVTAGAAQTINAGTLAVTVSSPLAGALAEMDAGGAQIITLNNGAGTATLTVSNFSAASGSLAQVNATGAQTIAMPYTALAGTIQIGGATTQGESLLYSGGVQTLLAGDILVQGGSTAAAAAKITSVGNSTMSAINGSVQVLGGSAGLAAIDPPYLDLITNGAITVQAGGAATATATITAGNIEIGATNGSVNVTGGTTGGAAATISATGVPAPGTLDMYASGDLVFTPNAGGATVSAVSPTGNNIVLLGVCVGCAEGLVGVFNLTSAPATATSANPTGLDDPSMGDLTSLLDYLQDLYGLLDADGTGDILLDPSQRLPQCE